MEGAGGEPESTEGPRVAVIGGGVAGMTAAHELAVRGFQVTVFEKGPPAELGGKARSYPVPVPVERKEEKVLVVDSIGTTDLDPLDQDSAVAVTAELHGDESAGAADVGAAEVGGEDETGDGSGKTPKRFPLPAEHGFRFFPGFYRHVIDSMSRTPGDGKPTAAHHLVGLDRATIARRACDHQTSADGKKHRTARRVDIPLPCGGKAPKGSHLRKTIRQGVSLPDLRPGEVPRFGRDMLRFSTALTSFVSSAEPRFRDELEERAWFEYLTGYRLHPESRTLLGDGLTRTFVATQAASMSARTGGAILLQLLYDMAFADRMPDAGPWASADRVLDGPTSDVWISPWRLYLEKRSETGEGRPDEKRTEVTFETKTRIMGLEVNESGEVTRLIAEDGEAVQGQFDYFVLAVPAEVLQRLIVRSPELVKAAPSLRGVFNLETAWMSGVFFYLKDTKEKGVTFPSGHVICLDSEWALTIIDQAQAWDRDRFHELVGQHGFDMLLSVDVSNWDAPGSTHHIPAAFPQPGGVSVREEVWRQICDHFDFKDFADSVPVGAVDTALKDRSGNPLPHRTLLEASNTSDSTLNEYIEATLRAQNSEPLLVNTVGSWKDRPPAKTEIRNLVVAGDYVQTSTDFASMEAANESARMAVDHIAEDAEMSGVKPKGYRSDRALSDDLGLLEPDTAWFAGPRRVARAFDRRVAYPFGWRAPFRAPMAAWAVLGSAHAVRVGVRLGAPKITKAVARLPRLFGSPSGRE